VDEAVEHGIGDGGITDVSVPIVHWQLAGDDGGRAAMTIIDDLQQVASLLCGKRGQSSRIRTWTRARLLSKRAYRPSPRARPRPSNMRGTRW